MSITKIFRGFPNYSNVFRTYCTVAATRSASVSQFGLLGPPELYLPGPFELSISSPAVGDVKDATLKSDTTSSTSTGDAFMDSMISGYNRPPTPTMGYTENRSPTYLTSGNPCLDFFFHIVPHTPADHITRRLKSAWEQDPSTALKLVCNLRGVRGTGKSDRNSFYTSALWLHENHPNTLAANVEHIVEFGYYKDLLEILCSLIVDRSTARYPVRRWVRRWGVKNEDGVTVKPKSGEEKRLEAANKGMTKYNSDPIYRFLHDKISELFAEHLASDTENLKAGKCNKLSLAAKWCPSLYSPYDNYTSMCESIGRRLFPRDKYPEYEGIEDAHYAYRVRDRLRKEVLAPLRKALMLPEVYMSAREWSSVVYTRVASIAMKNYKESFTTHDGERFQLYLDSVKKGNAKIAAGALLPHQIVKAIKDEANEVAELQWQRIVDDLSKLGKLKNCLAICDVSGSMYGEPLEVSVALGLLVSELSEEPWKGKLITFSEQPQLQVIVGEDLRSKISCIERMQWDMNTDFQKVFDKILEVAVEGKLTEEQMIKRLFVFSDMEFDDARRSDIHSYYYRNGNTITESHSSANNNNWETDYEAIVRKFNEKGFSRVPEIVFWNLRHSAATPVPSHQQGVALVSGFSKNLLKVFLAEGGILDPVKTMEAAIAGEEYQKLVVLD